MKNKIMNQPKMIIFDYGNTLIYETKLSLEKGYLELYKNISENPNNISLEEFTDAGISMLNNVRDDVLKYDIEIPHCCFFKYHFDMLSIKFDLPMVELETIFWEALAPCEIMPNIKKLLQFLDDKKIRTGVISNISFSEKALKRRINKYIPENKFEFIMASSEYGFRKPKKMLFELASKKANLASKDIWYCGDNPRADVIGSSSIGMTPVLFTHPRPCPYENDIDTKVDFDFLKIISWNELIEILK